MSFKLDQHCGNLFAVWVRRLEHWAPLVLIVTLLLAGAAGVYAFRNLRVDTDLNNLVSEELPFRRTETQLREQFPEVFDVLVMVLDAETPEAARTAALALAGELAPHVDLLHRVHAPRSDPFLEKNGLLYEDLDDLEDISQRLSDVQPLIGTLRRDRSLRGLFSALETAFKDKAKGEEVDLGRVTGNVDATIRASLADEVRVLSWREFLTDKPLQPDDRRQYVIASPRPDVDAVYPLKAPVDLVRGVWAGLPDEARRGVRMQLTGGAALSHEELSSVLGSMLFIGVLVTVLVGFVLARGLRSARLVVAAIVTVLVGLAWTAAMATFTLGHLNIVSVAFGVLYVGLSVDYAIHICLRYREGVVRNHLVHIDALCAALKYVGGSLVIATITTAVGFFSFVPTAYSGVSELGLISGTGMFISLFANMTVLPALLGVLPLRPTTKPGVSTVVRARSLREFPVRHPRAALIGSLVVVAIALALLPLVRFDYNPLNLNNPNSEAVKTFRNLLATSKTPPWTLHVLAKSESLAAANAEAMRELPVTSSSVSLPDLVPEDQDEKLEVLEETALTLGVGAPVEPRDPPSMDEQVAAIRGAVGAIETYLASAAGREDDAARGLRESAQALLVALEGTRSADVARGLEEAMLGTLPETLALLDTALSAEGFDQDDIPPHIAEQWVNERGIYRAEAFPKGDFNNMQELRAYTKAVAAVVPNAAGTPISMLSTGDVVVEAFSQALGYALVTSIVILLVLMRSVRDVSLVLLPLIMAAILTGGVLVLLDLSFNFANVIALPMLFGIGIDNGVHIVHRFRELPPGRAADINLLQTSTARGVVFSTLTTMCAFGSLALSRHAGSASLGTLLTIGMSVTLLATLITLPAMLTWLSNRKPHGEAPSDGAV